MKTFKNTANTTKVEILIVGIGIYRSRRAVRLFRLFSARGGITDSERHWIVLLFLIVRNDTVEYTTPATPAATPTPTRGAANTTPARGAAATAATPTRGTATTAPARFRARNVWHRPQINRSGDSNWEGLPKLQARR